MSMLKEVPIVSQQPDQPRRRWFTDDYFDLYVWFNEEDDPIGFQLCYDRERHERAVTWSADAGFSHDRIDHAGPDWTMQTPILTATEDLLPDSEILVRFEATSTNIDPAVRNIVLEKINAF